MNRRRWIILAACWIGFSLAAKAIRYDGGTADRQVQSLAAIKSFLADQGWVPETGGGARGDNLYPFTKEGCERRLLIIMLGTGGEEAPLLFRKFSGDAAFFETGAPTQEPSLWKAHLAAAINALKRVAGKPAAKDMPLFAVSPRPGNEHASCAGPPMAAWAEWLLH
jgi:hypothetical protein